jgi:hypothetical protein
LVAVALVDPDKELVVVEALDNILLVHQLFHLVLLSQFLLVLVEHK